MGSTLGARLKKQRQARGFTQRGLALTAHVSPALICKLEKGERDTIGSDALKRLARVLGCSADYLIDLYGDEAPVAATP